MSKLFGLSSSEVLRETHISNVRSDLYQTISVLNIFGTFKTFRTTKGYGKSLKMAKGVFRAFLIVKRSFTMKSRRDSGLLAASGFELLCKTNIYNVKDSAIQSIRDLRISENNQKRMNIQEDGKQVKGIVLGVLIDLRVFRMSLVSYEQVIGSIRV